MLRSFHEVVGVREVILQDRRKDIHPLDYHLSSAVLIYGLHSKR